MQPQDVLRVSNGFNSDWMPSGYRDVKVNLIVNEHLCEIQLHLGSFFSLKSGQHAVYEWARELNVTRRILPDHFWKNLSSEVTNEMIRLAETNWSHTEFYLPDLHLAAGNYPQAQEGYEKVRIPVACVRVTLKHIREFVTYYRRSSIGMRFRQSLCSKKIVSVAPVTYCKPVGRFVKSSGWDYLI